MVKFDHFVLDVVEAPKRMNASVIDIRNMLKFAW